MDAAGGEPELREEPPADGLPVVLRTTRASTIIECDDALGAILEVAPALLVGRPLGVFVGLWDRNQFRERLASLQADARCENWRFHLCVRGRTVPVIASVTPVSSLTPSDSRPGLRWQLREDRTRERGDGPSQRAQEIRDEETERVLAMMAHEVGQPLAAIVAYARGCLMRSKAETLPRSELERALERIVNEALRAGAIIRSARNPKVQR